MHQAQMSSSLCICVALSVQLCLCRHVVTHTVEYDAPLAGARWCGGCLQQVQQLLSTLVVDTEIAEMELKVSLPERGFM